MRLSKIQLSRVVVALSAIFVSGAGMLAPVRVSAQCAGTIQSITYDTSYGATVTEANGNAIFESYHYNLPVFPVSSNTLMAVVFKSKITVNASVTVQNTSGSPLTGPMAYMFRAEGLSSTPVNTGAATVSTPNVGGNLAAGASETFNMPGAFSNYPIITDSLTSSSSNFSSFTGTGSIPITYNENNAPLYSAGLTVTSTTFTDAVNFSITYYYCNPGTLATDILTFTAVKESDATALLSWTASNEQPGRQYIVQVSRNGQIFADSAVVASQGPSGNGVYTYTYPLDPNGSGPLYFRLRIVDPYTPSQYSSIAIIEEGNAAATAFSIFPNPPSGFINISLPGAAQNWNIEIYSADGKLVQRNYYPLSNLVHVDFDRKFARGTYFVRAINYMAGKTFSSSFVVKD